MIGGKKHGIIFYALLFFQDFIVIDAESNNWNRTIGLCGTLTDNIFDDFYHTEGQAVNINQFIQHFTVITSKYFISVNQIKI